MPSACGYVAEPNLEITSRPCPGRANSGAGRGGRPRQRKPAPMAPILVSNVEHWEASFGRVRTRPRCGTSAHLPLGQLNSLPGVGPGTHQIKSGAEHICCRNEPLTGRVNSPANQ